MRMRLFIVLLAFIVAVPAVAAQKQEPEETVEEKMAVFRQVSDLPGADIKVPTVIEVPLTFLPFASRQVAVLDVDKNNFVPSYVFAKQEAKQKLIAAVSNKSSGQDDFLTDNDANTSVDFDLPEGKAGQAVINLVTPKPVTADGLWIGLARHVTMPEKIEVRAVVDGKEKIILAGKEGQPACSTCIAFPETTSSEWKITMQFGQPLRITEIDFGGVESQEKRDNRLRFLAQPDRHYRIFRDPDRFVAIPTGESGNLADDKDVRPVEALALAHNPLYRESDADGDGIADVRDNCVSVKNPDQKDVDGNLRGDACDDWDRDSVINSQDNCPSDPNAAKTDTDKDGKGDICDGEESRLTEKYTWFPWLIMLGAAGLLVFLFIRVSKTAPKG